MIERLLDPARRRECCDSGAWSVHLDTCEKQAAERARIKAQAMRDHGFTGKGPYCQAKISFAPLGGPDTGTITGWAGCGYPLEHHPKGGRP